MNAPNTKNDFSPLVSIVIPVYNGGNYLNEAIDSALAQTYKNIEIVVVNDGSNDDGKTEEIAKRYGDRIRYFSKENGGCASALNLAIDKIQGEYFSWLSHDDLYEKDKVACQIEALKELNDRDIIIYTPYSGINHRGKKIFETNPALTFSEKQLNTPLFPLLNGLIHGCSLLIPKKYFFEIGRFNEELLQTQDYDLWFKFLRKSKVLFIDKPLIRSRQHAKQSTYVVPNRWTESNALWSGFLKSVTVEEMIEIWGSEYEFLTRMKAFVATANFKETEKLAGQMLKELFERDNKISVIIPFFERIAWTIEAIQSVQNQTYKNIEIIVINDGTTQDITELLNMVESDSRIKYFANKENLGAAVSRNIGIEKATGNYIAFLDSDDLFVPEKLETQLKYMKKENLLFSHTSYDYVDINKEKIRSIDTSSAKGNVFPNIICNCMIATPTVMAEATIFENEKFPEELDIAEDVCLWIVLASKYPFGAINSPLSQVRVNDDITVFDGEKQIKGLINIASFVVNHECFSQHKREIMILFKSAQDVLRKECPSLVEVEQSVEENLNKGLEGEGEGLESGVEEEVEVEPVEAVKRDYFVVRGGRLVFKAVRFFRKYGLRMTWDRTIERLKYKIT